jgi:hypothetical protein
VSENGMTAGARRAVVFLFVLAFVIGGINLGVTFRQTGALRSALTASCKFDSDLGAAPVAVNPSTGKASVLGVTIISDARVAWRGLGCTGELGRPAPSFVRWARYYHLPDG